MSAINAKERQEIKEYIEHTGKYEYIGILIREVEYRKNNEAVVLFRDKEDGTLCFITYREYKSMKKAEEQGYDYVLFCYPL